MRLTRAALRTNVFVCAVCVRGSCMAWVCLWLCVHATAQAHAPRSACSSMTARSWRDEALRPLVEIPCPPLNGSVPDLLPGKTYLWSNNASVFTGEERDRHTRLRAWCLQHPS